jgi:chloramphenicol 3-O-phosphotransferase
LGKRTVFKVSWGEVNEKMLFLCCTTAEPLPRRTLGRQRKVLMSYLIDGNNVMAQRVGWHRDKPGARRRLLEELARFAREAGVTVSLCSTGRRTSSSPTGLTSWA